MLNVAVSRAQYHFLVFGHMNIFRPDRNTPSGNLAKWLFDSPRNEISSHFLYQDEEALLSQSLDVPHQPAGVCRLSTLKAHTDLLRQAFQTARQKVVIVSPYISIRALESDNLLPLIQEAVKRGVEVVVYTDHYLDKKEGVLRENAAKGRQALAENHVCLQILKGIHNKTLVVDDCLFAEGSFNWLSASRNKKDARYECSIQVYAPAATEYIEKLKKELEDIEVEAVIYNPPERNIPCPGFFQSPFYNTCTDDTLEHFRQQIRQLGISKDILSASVQELRKKHPRHGEPWTEEEVQIIRQLMTYTNHLDIFIDCLQRSERSIRYKVEGTAP